MNKKILVSLLVSVCLIVGVYAALSVNSYDHVVNPENQIDSSVSTWGGPGANPGTCPAGTTWSLYQNNGICYESTSGEYFKGWTMLDYGANLYSEGYINISLSNFGDWGYGDQKYEPTGIKVFYTSDYDGASTEWNYLGGKLVNYYESPNYDSFYYDPSTNIYIDKLLVARVGLHTFYPNPRVYNITITG